MSEKTAETKKSILTTAMENAKAKMVENSEGAVELDDRAKLDAAKHLAKRAAKFALIVGTTAIVTRVLTVKQFAEDPTSESETPQD